MRRLIGGVLNRDVLNMITETEYTMDTLTFSLQATLSPVQAFPALMT